MDRKIFGGEPYPNLDLPSLEAQLVEVLLPVIPRVDFVSGLKDRLLADQEVTLLYKKQNPIHVLRFAGVFSGVLILLIGIRAIIALLGGKGYFQLRGQLQQKKSQTVGSVT